MTTTSHEVESSSYSRRRSYYVSENPSTSSWNTRLPSPPTSTRTSIESEYHVPQPVPVASRNITIDPRPPLSPPESVVGSSITPELRIILSKLKPVLEDGAPECTVEGVTPELASKLRTHLNENNRANGLR